MSEQVLYITRLPRREAEVQYERHIKSSLAWHRRAPDEAYEAYEGAAHTRQQCIDALESAIRVEAVCAMKKAATNE